MTKMINQQRGFGLIEALVALIIASVAMFGLFFSSNYARVKTYENYHSRLALLKASEILENIKYDNRNNKSEPILNSYSGEFILDVRNGNNLKAIIEVSKENRTELQISPYTKYSIITVKVKWNEPYKFMQNKQNNIARSITLKEDYFYNVLH